jgi:putative oxidoreductase
MSTGTGIVVLVGRVLFSVFFARSGIGHVRRHGSMGDYARAASFPSAYVAGWPAGLWLLAASLSIGLGIWPDLGSVMVAVFVVPAGLYFHRFWTLEDASQRQVQAGNLFRNVALLGASLAMFGLFVSFGEGLRFAITKPLFSF